MASHTQAKQALKPISLSAMKADSKLRKSPFDQSDNHSNGSQAFAMGTVMSVDYEKFTVGLRVNTTNYMHTPIPLTLPGAGKRHFIGAMPEVGDTCLVGWGQEASGSTRQPMIIGWVLSGVTAGHDWWPMQEHSPDEWGYSAKERVQWEGIADRHRHKLRHMLPGNIMASSSQGADLVLDESVLLSNRRGNEIRLRDQDQALVVRSLQQFHVGAGFRTYQGMVQRDSLLLPTSMVSDGTNWDAGLQVSEDGTPLKSSQLGANPVKRGKLTPNPVFDADGLGIDASLNPYEFLQNAMLIDINGTVIANTKSDAVYGGKSYYRVASDSSGNAATDVQADALTEYRLEVTHTSDGLLPVTEQTDGFDADRLPGTVPTSTGAALNTSQMPFVEFVLGSVVGNDPFSITGRSLYGIPLRPVIFSDDGKSRLPTLASGIGYDIPNHGAVLLSVKNPLETSAQPTWLSMTKAGKLLVSVCSVTAGHSIEVSAQSGMHLGLGVSPTLGTSFQVDADGPIVLHANQGGNKTNRGIEITTERGAVRIFGGQSETVGQAGRSSTPTKHKAPAVSIESGQGMLLKATGTMKISAPTVAVQNASNVTVNASSAVQVSAGDNISLVSKTLDQTTMGKATQTYGGPKDGSITNGPVREVQFVANPATGFAAGTADKYNLLYGDREENLTAGNHSTTIIVGNMTYETHLGVYKAASGLNSLQISAGGIQATATTGVVSISAAAGAISMSAGTACTISATGVVLVKGATVVLQASLPGSKTGLMISGADCDPVSGTPFSLLGMGSFGHSLLSG